MRRKQEARDRGEDVSSDDDDDDDDDGEVAVGVDWDILEDEGTSTDAHPSTQGPFLVPCGGKRVGGSRGVRRFAWRSGRGSVDGGRRACRRRPYGDGGEERLWCRAPCGKGDEPPCLGVGGKLEKAPSRRVGARSWGFVPKALPTAEGIHVSR